MSRLSYYLRRAVITVALIIVTISALFVFFRLLPGSYLDLIAQSGASQEQIASIKAQWGLDDPIYVQYFRFMSNLFSGQLGTSHKFGQPVWTVVKPRLLNSFVLVAPAIVAAYALGSLYGLVLGSQRDSLLEKYGVIPPTAIGTTPDFFIGILLIFIFSGVLNLLPSFGLASTETLRQLGQDAPIYAVYLTADFWLHYILPFSAIVLKYLYYPTLIMRSSVVEVSGQDFMYYHTIKGLPWTNRLRHLLRHASIPVLTLFPVSMARSISGLVLIEIVFNWPGIGSLLVESVLVRDTPVVQFVFMLVAIWVILGNLLVDILYGIIDPRISVSGSDA